MGSFIKQSFKSKNNMPMIFGAFSICLVILIILSLIGLVKEKIGYEELVNANQISEIFEMKNNTPKKINFDTFIDTKSTEIIETISSKEVTIISGYGGGTIPTQTMDVETYNVYILQGFDYNIIYLAENILNGDIRSVNVQKYATNLNQEIIEDYSHFIDNDKEVFVLYEKVQSKNLVPTILVMALFAIIFFLIFIKMKISFKHNSILGKEITRYGGNFNDTYKKLLEEEKNAVIKNSRIIVGKELVIILMKPTKIINIKDIKGLVYEPDEKYPKDIFNVYIDVSTYSEEDDLKYKVQTYSEEEAKVLINEIKKKLN